jgi:hypothetical protein
MDDLDLELDDVVIFELPSPRYVEAFEARLRPRWEGWSQRDEPAWLVTARLNATAELPALFHDVQQLMEGLGLATIGYCLDGRVYVLEPDRSSRAADLATRSK